MPALRSKCPHLSGKTQAVSWDHRTEQKGCLSHQGEHTMCRWEQLELHGNKHKHGCVLTHSCAWMDTHRPDGAGLVHPLLASHEWCTHSDTAFHLDIIAGPMRIHRWTQKLISAQNSHLYSHGHLHSFPQRNTHPGSYLQEHTMQLPM